MQKTEDLKINDPMVEKMFKAGSHYGYGKSRRHPSVKNYIYTTKNRTDIIDLSKTKEMLERALVFAKGLGEQNKVLLFVGTKPEIRELIEKSASKAGMPYVSERWIGGTLSNWSEIKKKIAELDNYRKEESEGKLSKYTKKEKLLLSKRMAKLERFYGGIMNLKKSPDALFIVDAKNDAIAQEEAKQANIPIITLSNSDSNITGIDYPIVANDSARPSISLFTEAIAQAYQEGTENAPTKKE